MMRSASLKLKNFRFELHYGPDNLARIKDLLLGACDHQQIRFMSCSFPITRLTRRHLGKSHRERRFVRWMSAQSVLPSDSSLRSFKGKDAQPPALFVPPTRISPARPLASPRKRKKITQDYCSAHTELFRESQCHTKSSEVRC